MTSRQHQDWINHGKPDSGLALPLQLLANTLAAAGYTVYVYPNDAHLDAPTPEDHTYYSETGWPDNSPKWWRHAIDIMPSHGGADLYALGQRIVTDRNNGEATWIKYINVPTSPSLSGAVQHSWKPGHSARSSSDTGHIHISSVTGVETLDSSYNPLTSVVVTGVITEEGPFMALTDQQQQDMYEWIAGLMDPDANPPTRSRFNWPAPQLKPMHDTVNAVAADVAAIKAAVATPPTVDVQALAAALGPLLADGVTAEQVQAALASDAGQAALVKAANTAEDS